MNMTPTSWPQRLLSALVLLLGVALAARVAADLLAPLVPALFALVLLCSIGWFVFGRKK